MLVLSHALSKSLMGILSIQSLPARGANQKLSIKDHKVPMKVTTKSQFLVLITTMCGATALKKEMLPTYLETGTPFTWDVVDQDP